ncbi:AAA domain-containing protein, partial [Thioclava dalianensis]
MARDFQDMDRELAAHRVDFPREKVISARAGEVRRRMVSLASIEPVLANNYMVKGWIDRNCLSMLYGPSNAGKTFVALDIAMHIASGQPW